MAEQSRLRIKELGPDGDPRPAAGEEEGQDSQILRVLGSKVTDSTRY